MLQPADLTAVILCGGEGLRFKNDYDPRTKVMAEVFGKPLVWHIMQHYANYGVKRFILCVRDDDREVASYFERYPTDWQTLVVPTGTRTSTGGRILHASDLIGPGPFFATYGDGVSNVNIGGLLEYHLEQHAAVTLTAVHPQSQYGILTLDEMGKVVQFEEKPIMQEWVNGGFFVFDKEIFQYLHPDISLETTIQQSLVSKQRVAAYRHLGFWKSVDTYKDLMVLQEYLAFHLAK